MFNLHSCKDTFLRLLNRQQWRCYLAATLSWRLVAVLVETSAGVAVTGPARRTAPPPVRTRLLHSGIRENINRLFLPEWTYRNRALVWITWKYHEVEITAGQVPGIGETGQSVRLICVVGDFRLLLHLKVPVSQKPLKPTSTDPSFSPVLAKWF